MGLEEQKLNEWFNGEYVKSNVRLTDITKVITEEQLDVCDISLCKNRKLIQKELY